MATDEHTSPGGPERGADATELEQEIRNAQQLLEGTDRLPRSFFVGVKHDNGADVAFVHGESEDLDEKVYDLFLPLALHCEQVAEAANVDTDTVFEVVEEMVDEETFSRHMSSRTH